MTQQRLYRSTTNKVFAGVCGGFAEYFDVDPVVLRILFVLMVLFGGTGVLLYIAAIFIVPKRPPMIPTGEGVDASAPIVPPNNERMRNWLGGALVIIGFLVLLANLEVFHFFDFMSDAFEFVFPVLLIILGMAVIYYRQSRTETPAAEQPPAGTGPATEGSSMDRRAYREFRRSASDKKIFGVCGGLAKYFAIDPSLIRILYVVLCLASFGAGFVLYLLIALMVPYDTVGAGKGQ